MSAEIRSATLFRSPGPREPRRRLICIPFAGGGVAAFRGWSRGLPEDVELLVVQLPGRESRLREPAFDNIPEIVEAVGAVVAQACELPYALFGHSMGALVAFELALALEAGPGRGPEHLFVSARRPPDEPEPDSPVHALPDDAFVEELQRRYRAIPDAVRQEPELLALLLPTLRADIRAIECYAPSSPRKVRCPVHVFGGVQDNYPRPAQLPGWQRVAQQGVRVRLFPGNHFYLAEQQAALLADISATWADNLLPGERP
jgi:surfactin synthase thioesterase subunit